MTEVEFGVRVDHRLPRRRHPSAHAGPDRDAWRYSCVETGVRPNVTSSCVAESGRNSTATESGTDADTNAEIACATSGQSNPPSVATNCAALSWHVGFGNARYGSGRRHLEQLVNTGTKR